MVGCAEEPETNAREIWYVPDIRSGLVPVCRHNAGIPWLPFQFPYQYRVPLVVMCGGYVVPVMM